MSDTELQNAIVAKHIATLATPERLTGQEAVELS
jgi:hypothetical protein